MATWLTLDEAAQHLRIGKTTLYEMARKKTIPGHRIGREWRFDVEELDTWVKSEKINPEQRILS